MDDMDHWFNGFRFSLTNDVTVFNPWSVMNSLYYKKFENY